MKRILLLAIAALIALPVSSFALGFLTINSVSVTQVDVDTYRLRADVDWGGPTILAQDILAPTGAKNISDADVNLSGFTLGGVPDAFNFYADMGGGGEADWPGNNTTRFENWQPLDHNFGFDFKSTGGLPATLHLDWAADLEWAYSYQITTRRSTFSWSDIAYSETLRGGYDVRFSPAIPEPTTLLLFGVGLMGAGLVRRRTRSSK